MSQFEIERIQSSNEFAQGAMDSQKSHTEDDIRQDMAFSEAYKNVYKYLNNEDVEDSQENLANSGMQLVSDIKNPLYTVDMEDSGGLGLMGAYAKFKDAPKEVKESLWYMWDKYDEADMTFAAFGRGMKSIGKDPSTYTGLAAGIKLFGAKAAGSVAMNRFKTMLLSGGVSGGFVGGEELVKQEVQDVEEYDWDKIQESATIGAVIGVLAPPAIEGVVKGTIAGTKAVGGKIADTIQEGEELMMQQAGGGVPPSPDFVSVLETALTQTSQKKWSKDQLKGYLAKQGVKPEEMKWSGIEDYLKDKDKVTTQELLENINQPQLEKNTLGKKPELADETHFKLDYNDMDDEVMDYLNGLKPEDRKIAEDMMTQTNRNTLTDGTFEKEWDTLLSKYPDKDHNIIHDVGDALFDEYHEAFGTAERDLKYKSYSTRDVGENYREELTTLDAKMSKEERELNRLYDEIAESQGTPDAIRRSSPKYKKYLELKKVVESQEGGKASYTSSHWDDKNVLYHARKQDTKIDGEDTLLIEEIQSDWHQEGRKKGYKNPKEEEYNKATQEIDKLSEETQEIRNNIKLIMDDKTYYEKNKQEVEALGNKFQEKQKKIEDLIEKRDTLSKELDNKFSGSNVPQAPYSKTWHEKAMKDQIAEAVNNGQDRIAWVAGKEQADRYSLSKKIENIRYNKDGSLVAWDKDGNKVVEKFVKQDKLSDEIGKDASEKLIKQDEDSFGGKSLKVQELEIGGEGMKGFYDKILPKWADKYIKKYGSKVETKTLSNGQEVWSFKITDKMKKDIKEKGQPLYQVGGATAVGVASQKEESKE